MRIAMVSEHASPLATLGGVDAGGQNVHVAALATALAGRGHEVVVYTRRDSWDPRARVRMTSGVDVVHVPAGPPRPVPKDELAPYMPDFGRWMARAWANGPAPDVVHSHFWMSGLAAVQAARIFGVPVLHTFHALGSVKRRFQGAKDTSPDDRIDLERALVENVDLVISTSNDEVTELARMGADVEHTRVVPCGADVGLFTPDGRVWPRSKRRRLVCIGRLVERKGVDTVVEALTLLRDAELVVAGGPTAEQLADDQEARRLTAIARELGVDDRLKLVGRVDHGDIPALLRSADVVVATPWYEPFGIVPVEAMACGRPVAGSAVGGLLDTVADGITGLLVPPRDATALAGAIRRLLDDADLHARFSRAARLRAVALYSWSRVARLTERAYLEVVRSRQTAAGAAV
jgi:D-inositol-3-phosphate glycosyltransferase